MDVNRKMPWRRANRLRPPMREFKKMVAVIAKEIPASSITDIFHAVRRRCPGWLVTPHRVRKALANLRASSAKKKNKSGGNKSANPTVSVTRVYPHDVIELRSNAARTRYAQWQWRGQVIRVAGYDDGEASPDDDEMLELAPGHCSVFWLGHGHEQWPSALTLESSIRVVDRPWVLGDRVARANDPCSLGTVVTVTCNLRLSKVNGSGNISPEVLAQSVRAVGGFRAEDWVASESMRWVGRIEEAVFRVEIELCGAKGETSFASRGRTRRKPPVAVFQVSSEGLPGLEPASGEDVTPQELSPHFPGQRVRAPVRLWRNAEWLRGKLGGRLPRRGSSISGVVTSVECCLVAVRWLLGANRESQPPDEWVEPETIKNLNLNSAECWAIGEHVQNPDDSRSISAVVVGSRSVVDVRWADGSLETDVASLLLCPRPHISAHDFLPHDFVTRSSEELVEHVSQFVDSQPPLASNTTGPLNHAVPISVDQAGDDTHMNEPEQAPYDEGRNANARQCAYYTDTQKKPPNGVHDKSEEILAFPTDEAFISHTQLGVVTSVNMEARTAVVQWSRSELGRDCESEEVSVFELTEHDMVDVRLGDTVLITESLQEGQWAGRVCGFSSEGCAKVELLDGSTAWRDVRNLMVVDDGEDGSENGDDGTASNVSARSSSDNLEDESSMNQYNAHVPKSAGVVFSVGSSKNTSKDPLALLLREAKKIDANGWCRFGQKWYKLMGEKIATPLDGHRLEEPRNGGTRTSSSEREVDSRDAELQAPHSTDATDSNETIMQGQSCIAGGSSSSSCRPPSEVLTFDVLDENIEPMDHFFASPEPLATRSLMMSVRREMMVLRKGLLEGSENVPAPIIVRTFASRSDLFRAMVVGPPGTPYAHVPFFFDFALPAAYPREPPSAHFHANFVGNERLNPNLYVDGKVCLSLLGTWSGPSWDPQQSTLLQVLVSLQGLVLVDEPYYNEPGHECDAGTQQGKQNSVLYNENARLLSLRSALNIAQNPPCGFREIVSNHFARYGPNLVRECEDAVEGTVSSSTSAGFRKVIAKTVLPRLRERWGTVATSSSSLLCLESDR